MEQGLLYLARENSPWFGIYVKYLVLTHAKDIPDKSPFLVGRIPVFRVFFHPLPFSLVLPFFQLPSPRTFFKLLFARETMFSYLNSAYTYVIAYYHYCSYVKSGTEMTQFIIWKLKFWLRNRTNVGWNAPALRDAEWYYRLGVCPQRPPDFWVYQLVMYGTRTSALLSSLIGKRLAGI